LDEISPNHSLQSTNDTKNPAMANNTKIDKYNPSCPDPSIPIAYLMNKAPAYKSA